MFSCDLSDSKQDKQPILRSGIVASYGGAVKWLLLYSIGPDQRHDPPRGEGSIGSFTHVKLCWQQCVALDLHPLLSKAKNQGAPCWEEQFKRRHWIRQQFLTRSHHPPQPNPTSGSTSLCPVLPLSLPSPCPEKPSHHSAWILTSQQSSATPSQLRGPVQTGADFSAGAAFLLPAEKCLLAFLQYPVPIMELRRSERSSPFRALN